MKYTYIYSPSRLRKDQRAFKLSDLGYGLFWGLVTITGYSQVMMAIFN